MGEIEGVRNWLNESGLAHEARVAESFRAVGFDVTQGVHYPAEAAQGRGAREVDVLARRSELIQRPPMTRCTVLFAVECKTSEHPWAALTESREAGLWQTATELRMNGVADEDLAAALDIGDDPWLFQSMTPRPYRVTATWKGPTKPNQRDVAFEAVAQAVSAADGVLGLESAHLPAVVLPVVAISVPLFGVRFDRSEDDVVPLDWTRLSWTGAHNAEPRAIDVVSSGGLAAYAQIAWEGAGEILQVLRSAAIHRREALFEAQAAELGTFNRLISFADRAIGAVRSRVP